MRVSTLRWTLATTAGFALGGVALHSPGASGVGTSYLEFDVSAAAFGGFQVMCFAKDAPTDGLRMFSPREARVDARFAR